MDFPDGVEYFFVDGTARGVRLVVGSGDADDVALLVVTPTTKRHRTARAQTEWVERATIRESKWEPIEEEEAMRRMDADGVDVPWVDVRTLWESVRRGARRREC